MPRAHGLVLSEVLTLLAFGVALAPPVITTLSAQRGEAQRIQDQRQVGNLMGALHTFASTNNGAYPLPSVLDAKNATVVAFQPLQKDNTGNIFSILIFNGLITPAELISPAESNTATVIEDKAYQYELPSRAAVRRTPCGTPASRALRLT